MSEPQASMARAAEPAGERLVPRLVEILKDMTQDWDERYEDEMNRDTRLLADLGFESIDVIHLVVAVEEAFDRRKVPFEKLLMHNGRYVDDLSIGQLADFLVDYL